MRVNYKPHLSRKEKKKNRIKKAKEHQVQPEKKADEEMGGSTYDQLLSKGLTSIKRKQIFKKHKRKDVLAEINQLKAESKKLNKRDGKQKAQKGIIAKKIKELKASISRSGEDEPEGSDSE